MSKEKTPSQSSQILWISQIIGPFQKIIRKVGRKQKGILKDFSAPLTIHPIREIHRRCR